MSTTRSTNGPLVAKDLFPLASDKFKDRSVVVEWTTPDGAYPTARKSGIWLGRVKLRLGVLDTGGGDALLVPTDRIVSLEVAP